MVKDGCLFLEIGEKLLGLMKIAGVFWKVEENNWSLSPSKNADICIV